MTRDLRSWVSAVEEMDELHRVSVPVDWDEEIGSVSYMRAQELGGPALLFENITGYASGRVLTNSLSSSYPRIGYTFNVREFSDKLDLVTRLKESLHGTLEPTIGTTGPVFENTDVGNAVDLYEFPAPVFWPKDGGRYLATGCCVLTYHPERDWLNVGTYRGMIHNETQLGLYISPGKDARTIINYWWEQDEPCEVAVVCGSDPLHFAMASLAYGSGESEYEYIGGLLGEPIEMVEGTHTDLYFPAAAELVVEGHLDPGVKKEEGPFGEFTGYYGRPAGPAHVIDVDAVHYRDDPIITGTILGDYPGGEHNDFISVHRSAKTWRVMDEIGVPGIHGLYFHPAVLGGNGLVAVAIKQHYPGHVTQVASLVAELPSSAYVNKFIVIVDEDVDPSDIQDVLWAMGTRCDPVNDVQFHSDTWSTWLDPSKGDPAERPYGSRILIDATIPHRHYDEFPERMRVARDMYEHIQDRWNEYGFDGAAPELQTLLEDRDEPLRHAETDADFMTGPGME